MPGRYLAAVQRGGDCCRGQQLLTIDRQHLDVVIGEEVLEEVGLDLHDVAELIAVDLVGPGPSRSAWAIML